MIYFEGIDKVGKDLVAEYFNRLTKYRYTVNVRGPVSAIAYSELYSRETQSTLSEITKYDTVVYLEAEEEDLRIRFKLTNERNINIEVHEVMFKKVIDELILMGGNIVIVNTSYETPYNIARTLKELFAEGDEANAKEQQPSSGTDQA